MTKTAVLAAVAHNIAHHAGSGLSFLSPHLAHALRAAGASSAQIDLLSPSPYPSQAVELEPLRLALVALQTTTRSLLAKHGFAQSDVSSVTLFATPAPGDQDGYSLHTRAIVTASNGKVFDSGWLQ
jgi:hypothetical protein